MGKFLALYACFLAPAFAQEVVTRPDEAPHDYVKPFQFETLDSGNVTRFSLECPLCVNAPDFQRTRPVPSNFGGRASWTFWHGRGEIYAVLGGVDATRPGFVLPNRRQRSRSDDDNWLFEGITGARVALDRGHHLWLGGTARIIDNLGDPNQFGNARTHWNSVEANLTYYFGK